MMPWCLPRQHRHANLGLALVSVAFRGFSNKEGQCSGSFVEQLDQVRGVETYVALLRLCTNARALSQGKQVHAHIVKNGLEQDRFLGNLLIRMYGSCNCVADACMVFEKMSERNVFSWNIMMAAYAQHGYLQEAGSVFDRMPQQNDVSWNTIIVAYAQKGHMQCARILFEIMPVRDQVSWNAMIRGYSDAGKNKEAIQLYKSMDMEGLQPDSITLVTTINASGNLLDLRAVHTSLAGNEFEAGVAVASALVNMHGRFGNVEESRRIFDKLPERNVVLWNVMLAAYTQNGHCREALEVFQQMVQEGVRPDEITLISVLDACASLGVGGLAEGRLIHAVVSSMNLEASLVVGTGLINMYGKCRSLEDARTIFEELPERDIVSWTAMLAAYTENEQGRKGIELFRMMDLEGLEPDVVTFTSVVDACASIPSLAEGKLIHASIVSGGFPLDVVLRTALVNLYGKCGSLKEARDVFNGTWKRDVVLWSSMIAAYAQNSLGKEALELFQEMQVEGIQPDQTITFVNTLSACSQAGLLKNARYYFLSMNGDYGVTPALHHYMSLIDLFARSGQLNEAEDLINNMPYEPDAVTLKSFLSACRMHGDVARAARVAEHGYKLAAGNSASYVLLSNIYTEDDSSSMVLDGELAVIQGS